MKTIFTILFFFLVLGTNAQVGIGTTTPNSTLDVRGSFSLNYRSFTSSTTALSTDNALEFTGSSAATLTLPDATTCTGRVYSIKNQSSSAYTSVLTIATSASQTIDDNASWSLDEKNEMIKVVSNGTNWNVTGSTPAKTRKNYVLVKSVTDFPAPVAGIITLVAGTLYEINGTITLTDKIDLNNCTIFGSDRINDKLDFSPTTGELFTGAHGGTIHSLTLSASGVGSKLFNLDASALFQEIILVEFVHIFNCDNIGLLKGFAYIELNTAVFSNNKNGITYENIGDFIGINEFWIADNRNTYETFTGTFQSIKITAGKKQMLSFFSAKGLDISGITSINVGASMKNATYVGDGIYVVGSFSNKWEVESMGLNTEKDDVSAGNLYVSTPIATSFSAINTPTKILGTTTSVDLFRVTDPSSNNLTYAGSKTKRFLVICALSMTSGGTNKTYSFYIAKNGVILPESRQLRKTSTVTDMSPITLSCTVSLNTNDYIEVWGENNTDAISMTVQTLNLAIK